MSVWRNYTTRMSGWQENWRPECGRGTLVYMYIIYIHVGNKSIHALHTCVQVYTCMCRLLVPMEQDRWILKNFIAQSATLCPALEPAVSTQSHSQLLCETFCTLFSLCACTYVYTCYVQVGCSLLILCQLLWKPWECLHPTLHRGQLWRQRTRWHLRRSLTVRQRLTLCFISWGRGFKQNR